MWFAVPKACPTPDPGQAFGHLGWLVHPSQQSVVKEFLKSGVAVSSRLQLEQLAGYAPELNADEGIWKHLLKYVELKNVCCRSVWELRGEF